MRGVKIRMENCTSKLVVVLLGCEQCNLQSVWKCHNACTYLQRMTSRLVSTNRASARPRRCKSGLTFSLGFHMNCENV
jgi:hypothetical protein